MNELTSRSSAEHLAGCVPLAVGDTLRVVDPDALLVYVPQGHVWITEEGGGMDIVLREGQWYRLRRRGVAVVEAFAPTVLLLTSPSADRPARTIVPHDRPALPPKRRATRRPVWEQGWVALKRWWQRPGLVAQRAAWMAAGRIG